jgi:uncharacterized protein involved in copper resistance
MASTTEGIDHGGGKIKRALAAFSIASDIQLEAIPGSSIPMESSALAPKVSPNQAPYGTLVDDRTVFGHVLFNQLEGRTNGPDTEFRWDGEGRVGTDYHRLWIKSEAYVNEQGHA